jgi:hypothetical protein
MFHVYARFSKETKLKIPESIRGNLVICKAMGGEGCLSLPPVKVPMIESFLSTVRVGVLVWNKVDGG